MFAWRGPASGPVRVFTDRRDGVSTAEYAGLNLGAHVGDRPGVVGQNRHRVEQALGLPVVYADQVHGAQVLHVTPQVLAGVRSETGALGAADALVTELPGLGLGVLVADCTPVLLHEADGPLVGAAHAGRPGMTQGVVPALVTAMRDLGATDLHATIGPSVCGRCYEVPSAMRAEAVAVAGACAAMTWTGTPAIDVAAGVAEQLASLEIPLTWVPGCAREDVSLYSYRRDGRTGRYAGIIGWPE